jgi:hypothetical protein
MGCVLLSRDLLNYLLAYLLTYLLTYVLTYLHTYLLDPWNRVLLEKLTGLQLVKKFSAFYGTRMFVTAFKKADYLSLSQARSMQSVGPDALMNCKWPFGVTRSAWSHI